jgi:hypothetical protein
MIFNAHSNLIGRHARLSASKYHWINYDEEKMARVFLAALAAERGTQLHAFAHDAIRLGIKLPKTSKTMNLYVNDAIGWRMTPEQPLYYSDNVFGTPDAIGFRNNVLRVNDLKTGSTPSSVHQLEVYAALFCLEYQFRPTEIDIELRIYQNDEIQLFDADPIDITRIMDKIVIFDKRINEMRMEVMS